MCAGEVTEHTLRVVHRFSAPLGEFPASSDNNNLGCFNLPVKNTSTYNSNVEITENKVLTTRIIRPKITWSLPYTRNRRRQCYALLKQGQYFSSHF